MDSGSINGLTIGILGWRRRGHCQIDIGQEVKVQPPQRRLGSDAYELALKEKREAFRK
jgi:hypothetical protein